MTSAGLLASPAIHLALAARALAISHRYWPRQHQCENKRQRQKAWRSAAAKPGVAEGGAI